MAQIPVSYTVNVNMAAAPRGLTERIVANVGLFSNEDAAFSDEYRVYLSPAAVEEDFGTDSVTYAMANAMFAQSPNLTSGRGSLYIFPYVATNATSSYLETGDISANIKNFKEVKNGKLTITVDNKRFDLENLNFSAVKEVKDVVKVLADKQADLYITSVDNKKIRFESKTFGVESSIEVTALLGEDNIDLTGVDYLSTTGLSAVKGVDAKDEESLSSAVNRVLEKVYFGQVLDTCYRENSSIKANATALASTERNYFEVTSSLENMEKLGNELLLGGFKNTKLCAYSKGAKAAKCMLAASVSRALATNYGGSQTCLTMNLKELATIDPDANMNTTYVTKAKLNGVDVYCNQGGLGVYFSNKGSGGYLDDMIGTQALANEVQITTYNYIRQVGTKVAQTESGVTGLKGAIAKVFDRFVVNGFLGVGLTWNGAEKFGDVEDFDRNIKERGYYIYSIPVAEQSKAEREGRICPLIQTAGKSAGAIHFVNVNGILEA